MIFPGQLPVLFSPRRLESRRFDLALAFCLYLISSLLATWPLAPKLFSSIPLGTERSPTVPLFNLWTLGWNFDRLLHGYRDYWQAPIFYPSQSSFAFSDPQPLTGLLAAPITAFNPTLAYNLILLLFLTLNGWAVYWFLRRRGIAPFPALLSGLIAQLLPYFTVERGVLQLQPYFGLLWAVDGLWSLLNSPDRRAVFRLALGVTVTVLTSEYYGVFLLLILAPMGLVRGRELFQKKTLAYLLLGLSVSGALILPFLLAQNTYLKEMGLSRSLHTIQQGSATLADYLRPPDAILGSRLLPIEVEGDQPLFPGLSLLTLGLTGGLIGLRSSPHRQWTLYLLLSGCLAFVVSLGLSVHLGGWQPYTLLFELIPGMENLRSPYRLALWVQIALLLLAALTIAVLWEKRKWGIAALLILVTLLELVPLQNRLTPVPLPFTENFPEGPIVFLPLPEGTSTRAYAETAEWMIRTLPQGRPLINGYSGYFTPLHSQLKTLLAEFPTRTGFEALRALGVSTILIRSSWLDPDQHQRLEKFQASQDLVYGGEIQGYQVYQVAKPSFSRAAGFPGEWALKTSLEDGQLKLKAYPAVPDQQIYVHEPRFSPLNWKVIAVRGSEDEQVYRVNPTGTQLFFHGSDQWLTASVPLPRSSGQVQITLVDAPSGRQLARTSITLP